MREVIETEHSDNISKEEKQHLEAEFNICAKHPTNDDWAFFQELPGLGFLDVGEAICDYLCFKQIENWAKGNITDVKNNNPSGGEEPPGE